MRKFTLNDLNPPKLPSTPVNRVIFVNDRSGSMRSLFGKTTESVQENIRSLVKSDKTTGQQSYVTIWEFDDKSLIAINNMICSSVDYRLSAGWGGGTALNDTVCRVIDAAKAVEPISSDESVLLLILTDGGECSSVQYGWKDVKGRIASLPENWTVTLIGPSMNIKWGESVGIPRDNMLLWDGSAATYSGTVAAQSVGLGTYVQTRATGAKATQSFYTVNPDKILPQEIEKLIKLPKGDFAVIEAPDAMAPGKNSVSTELAPMVRSYNYQFKTGVNYYELIKAEKIQENKDLLVMDENGNVYGKGNSGAEIRAALGLPTTGTITVHPQKGKYKIFVQSNSNNRKMLAWKDKTSGEVKRQKLIILL